MDKYRLDGKRRIQLDHFDPSDTSLQPDGKSKTVRKSEKVLKKLATLQETLYAEHRRKVLIVLQGTDTSGKDGTITHVMGGFNPQGVRIASFKAPSSYELDHDFLWRIHHAVPGAGEIGVFNRSHYEDVLVVRVHELVPETVWRRRYRQINEFERTLAETGTTILKFFLHISRDEQAKRLQARLDDPEKRWKFNRGDLDDRKLWDSYQTAYQDLLHETSTSWAPWYVVPSDAKWYRNWVISSVIADTMEGLKLKYPEVDLSDVVIE